MRHLNELHQRGLLRYLVDLVRSLFLSFSLLSFSLSLNFNFLSSFCHFRSLSHPHPSAITLLPSPSLSSKPYIPRSPSLPFHQTAAQSYEPLFLLHFLFLYPSSITFYESIIDKTSLDVRRKALSSGIHFSLSLSLSLLTHYYTDIPSYAHITKMFQIEDHFSCFPISFLSLSFLSSDFVPPKIPKDFSFSPRESSWVSGVHRSAPLSSSASSSSSSPSTITSSSSSSVASSPFLSVSNTDDALEREKRSQTRALFQTSSDVLLSSPSPSSSSSFTSSLSPAHSHPLAASTSDTSLSTNLAPNPANSSPLSLSPSPSPSPSLSPTLSPSPSPSLSASLSSLNPGSVSSQSREEGVWNLGLFPDLTFFDFFDFFCLM